MKPGVRVVNLQQVADALLKAEADVVPNPVVNRGNAGLTPQKPRLAGVVWSPNRAESFQGPLGARIVGSEHAKITLHGAESALIRAVAELESLDRPVVVVTEATLTRLPDPGPGGRIGGASLRQRSRAKAQRGANAQPAIGSRRFGTMPGIS